MGVDLTAGQVLVLAMVWVGGVGARAELPLSCEPIYRAAYTEYSKTKNPALAEAQQIYLIYFDYTNNLEEAYLAARPIFRALNTGTPGEPAVLAELSRQLSNGDLCEGNKAKDFSQVIESLRR